MRGEDDLIEALNAEVKREIIENYLRERRIVQEEIQMVHEEACAFHGGLADWEEGLARLAFALVDPELARDFFRAAGLDREPQPRPAHFQRPSGLTRCRSYLRLIKELYQDLYRQSQELSVEPTKVRKLMEEVNQDVLRFERDHDMLTISAYLRTLNPVELERRQIMGDNFTAREKALSAAGLSFRPVKEAVLCLEQAPSELVEPRQVMARMGPSLRRFCRRHGESVRRLWS